MQNLNKIHSGAIVLATITIFAIIKFGANHVAMSVFGAIAAASNYVAVRWYESKAKIISTDSRRVSKRHRKLPFGFKFIFSLQITQRVFKPAYNDLKADFLISKKNKSNQMKKWLAFWFYAQIFIMVMCCFGVVVGSKIMRLALFFVPQKVRRLLGI